ncbi:hypothetical protein FEZ40_16430 [Lacticaseibacillus paracasei]|nr:hypothetical protein FEZ40_16430 [Lacticaseibacillus paracasei]
MAIITLIERSQIELLQHHTIQYIAATLGRGLKSIFEVLSVSLPALLLPTFCNFFSSAIFVSR